MPPQEECYFHQKMNLDADYGSLSLVSLPGLPQLLPSYKPRDDRKWLMEVLSHQFPTARILSYQYDFAKPPSTEACWSKFFVEGEYLLYALVHRRKEAVEIDRPIVFMCHSFGGLILKQALVMGYGRPEFSTIVNNILGVLFFGCIHDERQANFEECCLRCASVELRIPPGHQVAESLKTSEKWIHVKELLEKFRELPIRFPIKSFFEIKETVYRPRRFSLGASDMLCSENMVRIDRDSQEVFPVNMDHLKLSTFPTRSDPLFVKIVEVIRGLLKIAESRQMKAEPVFNFRAMSDSLESTSLNSMSASGIDTPLSSVELPKAFKLCQEVPGARLPCRIVKPHQRNPNYVGREDIKLRLRENLRPREELVQIQRSYALCGLGGVGKTQTALNYVFEYMEDYQALLWAHADSRAKLLESFAHFAIELGLMEQGDSDYTGRDLVKEWFERASTYRANLKMPKANDTLAIAVPWLLIFDNADSGDKEEFFHEFWPAGDHGSILITSRDTTLYKSVGGEVLSGLAERSAVTLLVQLCRPQGRDGTCEISSYETEAALRIVEHMGYLPLAITQAAEVIVKDSCLLSDFLEAYNDREILECSRSSKSIGKPGEKYPFDLSTVWNMSFETLGHEQQAFVNLISFLDPDRIQLELLIEGAARAVSRGIDSLSFIDNVSKTNKCKGPVVKSSLVTQNEDLRELWMHRLVRQSCHLRMIPKDRQAAFEMAYWVVKTKWPVPARDNRHRIDLWPTQQAYFAHVQSLAHLYDKSQQEPTPLIAGPDFAELICDASFYAYESGLFGPVLPLLQVAEDYCMSHENCELILVDVYWTKGSVFTDTNRFKACLESFKAEFSWLQKAFQKNLVQRPNIREVFAWGGLGNGHQSINEYERAEECYRTAFQVWENLPGDRKIYTANMCTCLWHLGKLDEAERLLLAVITNRYDATSFRTGQAMFALGNIQIGKGKFDEAYETHAQTLNLFKASLGIRHHRTGDICHKLGWHLHRMRNYPAAITMLEQALSIYNNDSLYNNEIARTTYKLGCTLQDLGEMSKGRIEIEKAETLRRQILGGAPDQDVDEESFDKLVMFWSR